MFSREDIMNLFRVSSVIILFSTLFSASCGNSTPPGSSSAGALTAESALNNLTARPFGRHTLNATGSGYLVEFMRPDVRAKLDEEPVGDGDASYDPSAAGGVMSSETETESSSESSTEGGDQAAPGEHDEGYASSSRLDTLKYSWARKGFGDAVKSQPTNNGVIILYADENTYDVQRLTGFVEGGRNQIAERSGLGNERIQVVFGGYRAMPQVELWVIPEGGVMPEFKPDSRSESSSSEN